MDIDDVMNYESNYGTGEGDFQAGQSGQGNAPSPGNNDMTGYDDTMYGYTRLDGPSPASDPLDGVTGGYQGAPKETGFSIPFFSSGGGDVATEASRYSGGGGGGRVGDFSSSGGSSITYQRPMKPLPTLGAYGAMPTYDENRVKTLTQQKAAGGINKLRSAVSEAITRSMSSDNPYLRKILLKGTMSGFGEGVGSVLDSADTRARQAYETEYKGKLAEYQNNVNRENLIFEAAMRDFLANPYDMTIDPMTGKRYTEKREFGRS